MQRIIGYTYALYDIQPADLQMISQTSEYALRAVMFLAQNNDQPRTTAEIARRTNIPPGYLSKVLRTLSNAGLLNARRGIGGGFSLAKPPGSMTVLNVIAAVGDAVVRIQTCPLGSAEHRSLCAMHRMLDDVNAYIEDRFKTTTIQDLLDASLESHPMCEPSQRPITPNIIGRNRESGAVG